MKPRLVWLDMETTGLRDSDIPLEVGAVIESVTGGTRSIELTIHWRSETLEENLSEWAREQHTRTGLLGRVAASHTTLSEVETLLWRWVRANMTGDEPIHLAGSSIHFDRSFMRRWMPALDAMFHYRMLDVSAVRLAGLHWGYEPPPKIEKQHTPLSDIGASIHELAYWEKLFGSADR